MIGKPAFAEEPCPAPCPAPCPVTYVGVHGSGHPGSVPEDLYPRSPIEDAIDAIGLLAMLAKDAGSLTDAVERKIARTVVNLYKFQQMLEQQFK